MASRATRTAGSGSDDDAQARRARLTKAARWGAVVWLAFMLGSAGLALGIAGIATQHSVLAPIALALWVVLYGVAIYALRAGARARGDRTLQEHIARVRRTKYLREYSHSEPSQDR
ncbi:hypothetical protein ACQ7HM_08855 [Williamsia sp. MIQD14]|uniref:hypothetical protein n=1 Tax=Williamsia sp. MIQD14 TaxID=3425703 RepID=UPI003DA1C7C1